MLDTILQPLVLFFLLGLFAGAFKTPLRLPEQMYEYLSIYLLLAIGLKGGVHLAAVGVKTVWLPLVTTVGLGLVIPLLAYALLRVVLRFALRDSAALAAHYGSVSAVTFAVAVAYLDRLNVEYEAFVIVLLVVMEVPALVVGILLAKRGTMGKGTPWGALLHEVFLNKSIYLLIGGMVIGYFGADQLDDFRLLFFDLFKGLLAFFLLELGIIVSHRLADVRILGLRLLVFGIVMPVISGTIAVVSAHAIGMSEGGAVILATLAASASYIAAPAAMRIAIPDANPALYLTASLGITFPFNVAFGIPLYHWIVRALYAG